MLTSPDAYYEMNLKGKTEKEILSAIRGLKNEIGHLKNMLEHPDDDEDLIIYPSKDVRIGLARMYIERAKEALQEIGATYVPSKAEQKAQRFQENIDHIKEIRFVVNCYMETMDAYTLTFKREPVQLSTERVPNVDLFATPDATAYPMSKAELLAYLRDLHIGEWRRHYEPDGVDYVINDGEHWTLEIEYSNGVRMARYTGNNACPYNFNRLKALFRIEDDMD